VRQNDGVDLEEFYEADPRRRHSEELEFGREWSNENGRCEVSWVEDTGELYAMAEPFGQLVALDGIGDEHVRPVSEHQLMIEVLGVISDRNAIEAVMSGWEDAMPGEHSLDWVRGRVANAANEQSDPPARPSDDMPTY